MVDVVRGSAIAIVLTWASAVAAADQPPRVDEKVSAPSEVVVGFLPPDSDPFWRAAGAPEHEYHVATALTSAAACLESKGVVFRIVHADRLELDLGSTATVIDLKAAGRVGAVLARRDSPAKVLSCSAGTSPLQIVVPVMAARYFGHPECIPGEWSEIAVSEKC